MPSAKPSTKPSPRRAASARHKPTRRKPVSGRRKKTAAAGLALLAVLALVVTITAHHDAPAATRPLDVNGDGTPDTNNITIDLDHDGKPDTAITVKDPRGRTVTVPLSTVTTDRDTITTLVAPHPNTPTHATTGTPGGNPQSPRNPNATAIMLTPPGDDWWTTATSMAPALYLWNAPAPDGALWYAATTNPTNAPNPWHAHVYDAVHVGFATTSDANAYLARIGMNAKVVQWIRVAQRGPVITFTPAYINPATEPLPVVKGQDAHGLTHLHPQVAAWTINYAMNQQRLAESTTSDQNKTALLDFFADLGYTDTTQWNGVATTPTGPWRGTLTGYQPDHINIEAAAADLGRTVINDCNATNTYCQETDPGLNPLGYAWAYYTPSTGFGVNPGYLPGNAPQDAVLRFGLKTGYASGIIDGTDAAPLPPIQLIQGWITPTGDQVLYTKNAPAPDLPSGN